eukprot:1733129-Prymnesium_polylepis.1
MHVKCLEAGAWKLPGASSLVQSRAHTTHAVLVTLWPAQLRIALVGAVQSNPVPAAAARLSLVLGTDDDPPPAVSARRRLLVLCRSRIGRLCQHRSQHAIPESTIGGGHAGEYDGGVVESGDGTW